VVGFCEHGNELSGSIICWEILEWLIDWRLIKKSPVPWCNIAEELSLCLSVNGVFSSRTVGYCVE
jgi:hypothetical protein